MPSERQITRTYRVKSLYVSLISGLRRLALRIEFPEVYSHSLLCDSTTNFLERLSRHRHRNIHTGINYMCTSCNREHVCNSCTIISNIIRILSLKVERAIVDENQPNILVIHRMYELITTSYNTN